MSKILGAPWLGLSVVLALSGCGGGSDSTLGEVPAPALQWSPPGGNATVALNESSPFMQFAPSVDVSEMAGVSQGRELFVAEWQPAPGTRPSLDGLGPLFNANACTACHASTGRVPVLAEDGSTTPAILFRLGNAAGEPHPVYGGQLQSFATAGIAEGTARWQANPLTGGINYALSLFGLEPMGAYLAGPRISPQLVGMGLLDRVPEAQILEYADENDANGDGISGRPHWITDEGVTRLGRFGWKAINTSLRTQNANAMHQDMGLTTSLHPAENCTMQQPVCSTAASGGAPEVPDASLAAVVDFMTVLAVPDRRIVDQALFNQGATLFNSAGCTACHRETLKTGTGERFPSLSGQTIYAYTDLLLHDMGEDLSDGVKEKNANPREWRTPPLWGLGLVEQKAGGRFLHDGRAKDIPQAIGWHGGEAQKAKERFQAFSAQERAALLVFLRGI